MICAAASLAVLAASLTVLAASLPVLPFSYTSPKTGMLGLSLPSRCFSSSTLMDGEAVLNAMNYDDWSAADLEAELAKLEEFRV